MNDSEKSAEFSNVISPHSISVYGSSVGHSPVSENALVTLSYDVTYRLYEILKECKTQMNVYRQQTLSTTILNNVLQSQGVPPFFGNKVLIPFVSIQNSDMSVLHMNKIDLLEQAANDVIKVEREPVPFIQGMYILPSSKTCSISDLMKSLNSAISESNIKAEPRDDYTSDSPFRFSSSKPSYSQDLSATLNRGLLSVNRKESDYFLVVAKIILNSPEAMFKVVLDDLKTNPRLGNIYFSLLNLISNAVKNFKCVGKLIDRLLRTLEALLDNPHIDGSSSFSVDDAVDALRVIVLEPKIANDCDDFVYRRRASYLLMRALNTWNIGVKDRNKTLSDLKRTLASPEKMSLKLNYSVLIMFHSLGCDVLDSHFWPMLPKYLSVLRSLDEIVSGKRSALFTTDICHVKSALLLISGILYRNFWIEDPVVQRLHITADALLSEYFAESLLSVRSYAVPRVMPVFATPGQKRSSKDSASDAEKGYRNLQIYPVRQKFASSDASLMGRGRPRRTYALHEVFETVKMPGNQFIVFNFIGSNQLDRRQLVTRRLDRRFDIRWNGTSSRPFLKYERTTRCIKYCSTKKCSGDINLFV